MARSAFRSVGFKNTEPEVRIKEDDTNWSVKCCVANCNKFCTIRWRSKANCWANDVLIYHFRKKHNMTPNRKRGDDEELDSSSSKKVRGNESPKSNDQGDCTPKDSCELCLGTEDLLARSSNVEPIQDIFGVSIVEAFLSEFSKNLKISDSPGIFSNVRTLQATTQTIS